MLFNSTGYVINAQVDGCVQMKCFLQGNSPLKLALNEDLIIGRSEYSQVCIDDCNFHECVNSNDFELNKMLRIQPPDGEFTLMNYRVNGDFQVPFRIYPFVDDSQQFCLEIILKIKNMIPKDIYASYAQAKFAVPQTCQNVSLDYDRKLLNQKAEFNESTR